MHYRTVIQECKCGYSFRVRQQIKIRLIPGHYPRCPAKKEVIIKNEVLDLDRFKKVSVVPIHNSENMVDDIKLLACPNCNNILCTFFFDETDTDT